MNRRIAWLMLAGVGMLGFTPGRADTQQLSADRLDALDRAGFFTPGFKQAVHDLVENRQGTAQANAATEKLNAQIPGLQQQMTTMQAKAAALRQELEKDEHPEETDSTALQKLMNDPNAKAEEQVALAQAYVWTYPASPHESDAQQDLRQLQKKIADEERAKKDSAAAQVAAHAKLVQRAQARDLNLGEWKDFLRDMSEEDLIKMLGQPTTKTEDDWIYSDGWIVEPETKSKAGMMVNFNAGRVYNVVEAPHIP